MLQPGHFDGQRVGIGPLGVNRDPPALPAEAQGNGHSQDRTIVLRSLDLNQAESLLIARALEVTEGNRTRAAELLGVNVRTLRNKLNSSRE